MDRTVSKAWSNAFSLFSMTAKTVSPVSMTSLEHAAATADFAVAEATANSFSNCFCASLGRIRCSINATRHSDNPIERVLQRRQDPIGPHVSTPVTAPGIKTVGAAAFVGAAEDRTCA